MRRIQATAGEVLGALATHGWALVFDARRCSCACSVRRKCNSSDCYRCCCHLCGQRRLSCRCVARADGPRAGERPQVRESGGPSGSHLARALGCELSRSRRRLRRLRCVAGRAVYAECQGAPAGLESPRPRLTVYELRRRGLRGAFQSAEAGEHARAPIACIERRPRVAVSISFTHWSFEFS